MKTYLTVVILILLPGLAWAGELVTFPSEIKRACRGGSAKIYDECADQNALFQAALQTAKRQNKTLLVSYGAEWCIWCHVFHDYILGASGTFTHPYSTPDDLSRSSATMFETPTQNMASQAKALKTFVAETFVLLHLETRYAEGADQAVKSTGFDPGQIWNLPFIFTVSPTGRFAMALDDKKVETRREGLFWFRGYDRLGLLDELRLMQNAAKRP